MALTYLIIDDHGVVRSGLRALLGARVDGVCVGEAGTAAAGLERALATNPDLILLDIELPDLSGFEVCRTLTAKLPATKVLVVTVHEEPDSVDEAFRSGASGFLAKRADGSELARAVAAVMRGEQYVPATAEVESPGGTQAQPTRSKLTGRERQVLHLIATGHTNGECAIQLGISIRTVETHRASIIRKLGTPRRWELARRAREWGIVD